MSNLLQVIRFRPQAAQKRGATPLIMEMPVDPGTAPYLVSSSTSLMWIEEPHPGDVVKTAVRNVTSPGNVFRDVLDAVCTRSARDQWGSVYPFSADGVRAAVRYLESYDLEDVEVIVPRIRSDDNPEGAMQRPKWLVDVLEDMDLNPRTASWVPDDCVIVVPTNREFVGIMGHLDPKRGVVLVHNASRGISVARGAPV